MATAQDGDDAQRAKTGLRRLWIPALSAVAGAVLAVVGTAWWLADGEDVTPDDSADVSMDWLQSPGDQPQLNRDSLNADRKPLRLPDLDRMILNGSYEFAAELINDGAVTTTKLTSSRILFRQGLAEELAGENRKALEAYHSLVTAAQGAPLADVGLLSAARVLINDGQLRVGVHLMMKLLMSREQFMHDEVRSHMLHSLASGLVGVNEDDSLLDPLGWSLPLRKVTPEEMLHLSSVDTSNVERPSAKASFRVENLTNTAGGIFVSARSRQCSVLQLIQAAAHRSSCSLSISDEDRKQLDKRELSLGFRSLPLDIVLDCLLLPLDFEWTFNERRLTVQKIDIKRRQSGFSDQTARRFLAFAVNISPECGSAPFTYLRLGAHDAKHKGIEAAEQSFSACRAQFPDSAAAESASFNLGKIYLGRNERQQALECFYRTVDGVSGPEIDAVAYIYIGRILLADDSAAEAIGPLMRGLFLSRTSEHEAQAAVLLSAAYLMSGNAVGANSVLTKHRRAFVHPSSPTPRTQQLKSEAAFLSSLARYHNSGSMQKKREAEALMSALSAVDTAAAFGEHSSFLMGIAYGLVGLQTEQEEVLLSSLQQPDEFALQRRMSLILSQRLRSEDALQPNPELTEISPMTVDQSIILKRAKLSFRAGQHDEVMKLCSGILWLNSSPGDKADTETQSDETNRAALRLMGLVYQARGEHLKAVRCFAGIQPQAL